MAKEKLNTKTVKTQKAKVETIKSVVTTPSAKKSRGQIVRGRVVAAKSAMTVTVIVERKKMHPLYHKSYKRSKNFLVHDEIGVKPGDLVEMVQVRPISKNKHFMIVAVVGRNIEEIVSQELQKSAAEAISEVMPEEEVEVAESVVEVPVVVKNKKEVKSKKLKVKSKE